MRQLVKWQEAQKALTKIRVEDLPKVRPTLKLYLAGISELKAQKDFQAMRQADTDRVWLVWRAGQTVAKVQAKHGEVGRGGEERKSFTHETLTSDGIGISKPDAWRWKMVAYIPKSELKAKLESWAPEKRISLNQIIAWGKSLAPKAEQESGEGPEPSLYVGRAEAMDFLEDETIDIAITSPPYNLGSESWPMGGKTSEEAPGRESRDDGIGYVDAMSEADYQKWQIACLNEVYRVAKKGASFFYNHKVRQRDGAIIQPMDWVRKSKWTVRQEIVWDRKSTHNHVASLFWPIDERIYWLTKGAPNLPDHPIGQSSVWHIFGPVPGTWHPAPFCEDIPRTCLEAIGKPGDIVLDPFAGSFTTCRVAQTMGYASIGVETQREYAEKAAEENGWTMT